MSDIAQDLGGVVRLLEKATPGPWEVTRAQCGKHGNATTAIYNVELINGINHVREVIETPCKCGDEAVSELDAETIAAAINFLRTYSAEIAGALRDAERYRWLREHVTDRFVRNNEHEPCLLLPHNVDYLSPDEIDTAIDSAMQQGGGGE